MLIRPQHFCRIYICTRELSITNLTPLNILGHLGCASAACISLSTALGLVRLLPVLDILQGGIPLCATELRLLCRLLLDIIQTQTNNGTLNLVRSRTTLLEVGLRESLLVEATPRLGPYKLGGLFALEGETLGLGRAEEDGLSITADKKLAGSGPDPVFGHCA